MYYVVKEEFRHNDSEYGMHENGEGTDTEWVPRYPEAEKIKLEASDARAAAAERDKIVERDIEKLKERWETSIVRATISSRSTRLVIVYVTETTEYTRYTDKIRYELVEAPE